MMRELSGTDISYRKPVSFIGLRWRGVLGPAEAPTIEPFWDHPFDVLFAANDGSTLVSNKAVIKLPNVIGSTAPISTDTAVGNAR
jgi:hypothetical protein